VFVKRKDLIVKLGNEFEKFVVNAESICEEIKIALHEEIADHTISSRDIERYCHDNWKKKTKPQKKDNLSFLTKIEGQEKEEQKTIVIDTSGSLVDEPKPIDTKSQICINESNCDVETQEISRNIEDNTKNLHTCPNCKQPLLENQRVAHEKDIKIKELKDELQHVHHDLNIKIAEKAGIQTQFAHLKEQLRLKDEKDVNDINVLPACNTYRQLESSSPIIDLEFTLQYEEVRRYVSSRLKITGVLGLLWFNFKLDKRTFRIVSAYPGSIVERKSLANKEDNRNE
jgi:hypothetical protein